MQISHGILRGASLYFGLDYSGERIIEATFDLFEYVWESWWLGVRAGERRQVDVGPSSKQLDLHAARKDQILTRGNTRTPERKREREVTTWNADYLPFQNWLLCVGDGILRFLCAPPHQCGRDLYLLSE
jgi:hypothetical protein